MQLLNTFHSGFVQGASSGGTVDWKLILGIPATLVAALALTAYVVGVIRPVAVKKARYWDEGETTRFSCAIRNRSLLWDRNISSLSVGLLPPWWQRLRHPGWDREAQVAEIIPFGDDIATMATGQWKLTKREERTIKGEFRRPTGAGLVQLEKRHRFRAHAGSKRSRSKRPRRLEIPSVSDENRGQGA
jgi:hypothetical protein